MEHVHQGQVIDGAVSERPASVATCQREHRAAWRVTLRECGYPAFGGHVRRETKTSGIVCDPQQGGCGRQWRTGAAYVASLLDYEPPPPVQRVCMDCGRGDLEGNPLVSPSYPDGEYDPQTRVPRPIRYWHVNPCRDAR
jgi:hypothetical protein